jgi:hypothetical protein
MSDSLGAIPQRSTPIHFEVSNQRWKSRVRIVGVPEEARLIELAILGPSVRRERRPRIAKSHPLELVTSADHPHNS